MEKLLPARDDPGRRFTKNLSNIFNIILFIRDLLFIKRFG